MSVRSSSQGGVTLIYSNIVTDWTGSTGEPLESVSRSDPFRTVTVSQKLCWYCGVFLGKLQLYIEIYRCVRLFQANVAFFFLSCEEVLTLMLTLYKQEGKLWNEQSITFVVKMDLIMCVYCRSDSLLFSFSSLWQPQSCICWKRSSDVSGAPFLFWRMKSLEQRAEGFALNGTKRNINIKEL